MPRKTDHTTTAKKQTVVPPMAPAKKEAAPIAVVSKSIPASVVAAAAIAPVVQTAPTAVVEASVPATVAAAEPTVAPELTVAPAKGDCGSGCGCSEETRAAAFSALESTDADLARDAATSLGFTRDASAAPALIGVLGNTDGYYHNVVRAAAAQSLGLLGGEASVDALLIAITDASAEVSAEAIHALGEARDASAVNALIDVVNNRTGFFAPVARRAAVIALGRFATVDAIDRLAAIAGDESEEPSIRTAAEASVSAK